MTKSSGQIQKDNPQSLLALIASMVIFGTVGLVRRYIPLSSSLIAFFRGIIGAGLLFLIAKIQRRRLWNGINGRILGKLLFTGALIGINWSLLFEAFRYTSVSIATLCYYMQPIFLILLSAVLSIEKLTVRKIMCILFAFAGMILISGVLEAKEVAGRNLIGILLALGAALLYAFVVILNKKVSEIDSYSKTIIQLGAASMIQVPYLLITGDTGSGLSFDFSIIVLLLIISVVHTGIAYSLYFSSIERLKTQTVALFSYIDPATAVLCSALFLRESMSAWGWIGTAVIFGAIIFAGME